MMMEILQDEVGHVFANVLEDAGVYKRTEAGPGGIRKIYRVPELKILRTHMQNGSESLRSRYIFLNIFINVRTVSRQAQENMLYLITV